MFITKRIFDFTSSFFGIILLSPIFLIFMILIFLQDGHSPLYKAPRVGKNGKMFRMIKLRSMIVGADKAGVDTASVNDNRITKLGIIIRKYKIDELLQLWNVLKGEMSIVGPRPNVKVETDLYTQKEKGLLAVKPGISDLSSIVFGDLGEIVANSADTNISYNQLVRPWKSRLGLIYIENMSLLLDLKIIFLTLLSMISREQALKGVTRILEDLKVSNEIIRVSKRQEQLVPTPPPGSQKIVTER
ncbi:MAG: sugar transferase [Alphaproteobacteria bacterium]|nr:sugar transferase [Alphaproteobacteria bacterium]